MKNVVILGLGAIGASIAAQFSDANYPVTILCNAARKERYQQNGFIVNDKKYNFNYLKKDEYNEQPSLILIAVKYHDLGEAIKQLDGLIGKKAAIMSLLNGIDSEEIIAERFGYKNIVHAFIYNIDATKENNNVRYFNRGIIVFGDTDNWVNKKTSLVKKIFDEAKINYEFSDHIMKRMWWKYMANIGVNQTTATLKATYRVLQEVSYAQELARDAMQEAVLVSKAMKINLSQEDIDHVMELIKRFDPDGKTSMVQDVEAKRKTEVEMFSGKLCQLGEQYNVPTPVNWMYFRLIKSIEAMSRM